jgi:hypothetical protein
MKKDGRGRAVVLDPFCGLPVPSPALPSGCRRPGVKRVIGVSLDYVEMRIVSWASVQPSRLVFLVRGGGSGKDDGYAFPRAGGLPSRR